MFKMMNDMTEPSKKPQQTRDVTKSQLLKRHLRRTGDPGRKNICEYCLLDTDCSDISAACIDY